MKNIEEQIKEIERDLIEVDISYQIWRSYKNPENRDLYQKTLKRYQTFFRSIIDAQFMSVIVSLNRLLERSEKTTNLVNLRSQITSEMDIPVKTNINLDSLELILQEKFKKLVILRSNVFAHRSRKKDISDLYKKAGISPNLLDESIKCAQEFYNELIRSYQNRTYRFDFIDFVETDEVMEKLAKNDQ